MKLLSLRTKCSVVQKVLILLLFSIGSFQTVMALSSDNYKNPDEVNSYLRIISQGRGGAVMLHSIATSPGGTEILMLEIGSEALKQDKMNPAILVVGNMDGKRPITTEAALLLIDKLLADSRLYSERTWYILPMGNPDAAQRYFSDIVYESSLNNLAHNDDMDEQVDEDGFNDLDENGVITMMRKKTPDGNWIPVKTLPGLMRKADNSKGEKGIYKLYTEGIDDDGDGLYNEDGPGGVNVNANFPHMFGYFKPGSGMYPGSTPETLAIMKFAFEHPEIAMTFSFGSTNFLLQPPKGGRSGSVDMEKITIPADMAKMIGAESSRTYSMKEIMDLVKPILPAGMTVDEGMIASFLGLGAVVNPMKEDLVFYNKISEDYKEYLKKSGLKGERFDPLPAKDGSFELWSYYHLGVPVFSMDLWGLPKPKAEKKESSGITLESLGEMSSEEFVELGEEKINLFLKENGAPAEFKAEQVIEMMKSGQFSPEQMATMMKQMPKPEGDTKLGDPKEQAMLAFSNSTLDGKGLVEWKEYDHPDLGEIEIGGFVPYLSLNPKAEIVDSLLGLKVPFLFELADYLPKLNISNTKVKPKGAGIYEIEMWIENSGFIPFCTAMGMRNKVPVPAIINISGKDIKILSGKKRTPLSRIEGKKAYKLSWLVKVDKKTTIQIDLSSKTAGFDSYSIQIGE